MKKLMTILMTMMVFSNAQAAVKRPVEDMTLAVGNICIEIQNSMVTVYRQDMWMLVIYGPAPVSVVREDWGGSSIISEDGNLNLQDVPPGHGMKNQLIVKKSEYGAYTFTDFKRVASCPFKVR